LCTERTILDDIVEEGRGFSRVKGARSTEVIQCFAKSVDATHGESVRRPLRQNGGAVVTNGIAIGRSIVDAAEVRIEPCEAATVHDQVTREAIQILIEDGRCRAAEPE
jgi:hypothetical protein